MIKYLFGMALILVASYSSAGVNTTTTNIKEIYSYADVGDNGDVIFTITDPLSECTGFWLKSTSNGFKNTLSVLLSAYHADSPVLIYANENDLWGGSSGSYCRLTIIRLRAKG